MKLNKEEARNVVWEDHDDFKMIENEMVNQRRWETDFECVVQQISTGKYYSVEYSKGSTEQQDVRPFEYDDEVEFTEVEPYEVTKIKYRKVK